MKPRVLQTYKILAVALTTSTAACAPSTGGTSGLAPQTAESVAVVVTPSPVAPAVPGTPAANAAAEQPGAVAVSEDTTAAAAMLVAALPAAAPVTPAAPAAAPVAPAAPAAPAIDPAMYQLREDLMALGKGAFTQVARFKPLCDSEGYPLVGNVVRGKGDPGIQPSSFCAEIRRTASRRTASR